MFVSVAKHTIHTHLVRFYKLDLQNTQYSASSRLFGSAASNASFTLGHLSSLPSPSPYPSSGSPLLSAQRLGNPGQEERGRGSVRTCRGRRMGEWEMLFDVRVPDTEVWRPTVCDRIMPRRLDPKRQASGLPCPQLGAEAEASFRKRRPGTKVWFWAPHP